MACVGQTRCDRRASFGEECGSLEHPPEAVAGRPAAGPPRPGSAELPRSRQARAEEAQGASWGAAKGGTLTTMLPRLTGWLVKPAQVRAGRRPIRYHEGGARHGGTVSGTQ